MPRSLQDEMQADLTRTFFAADQFGQTVILWPGTSQALTVGGLLDTSQSRYQNDRNGQRVLQNVTLLIPATKADGSLITVSSQQTLTVDGELWAIESAIREQAVLKIWLARGQQQRLERR